MFDPKQVRSGFAGFEEPLQALMQGDQVVAVIFEQRYVELFSQAPQMLVLVEKIAAASCDIDDESHDDEDCVVCEAKRILAGFMPAPMIH